MNVKNIDEEFFGIDEEAGSLPVTTSKKVLFLVNMEKSLLTSPWVGGPAIFCSINFYSQVPGLHLFDL